MTTPATNRQVPDHSIMDAFNKQNYLGNQFIFPFNSTIASTAETALILLSNPAVTGSGFPSAYKAIFTNYMKSVCLTASQNATFRTYYAPTITAGTQTVAMAADSGGSLNSTYFLLNGPGNTDKYYVWFNINSAGVDPAVASRTGIQVAGATNASAATLGAAMVVAINLAAAADFTATGTSTVTLTNTSTAAFTAIVDGAAPTSFVFAVTSVGVGTVQTAVNTRPASGVSSIASLSTRPTASANGTLVQASACIPGISDGVQMMNILDPSKSLLITVQVSANSTVVCPSIGWFEL